MSDDQSFDPTNAVSTEWVSRLQREFAASEDVQDLFAEIPDEMLDRVASGHATNSDLEKIGGWKSSNPEFAFAMEMLWPEAQSDDGPTRPAPSIELPIFFPVHAIDVDADLARNDSENWRERLKRYPSWSDVPEPVLDRKTSMEPSLAGRDTTGWGRLIVAWAVAVAASLLIGFAWWVDATKSSSAQSQLLARVRDADARVKQADDLRADAEKQLRFAEQQLTALIPSETHEQWLRRIFKEEMQFDVTPLPATGVAQRIKDTLSKEIVLNLSRAISPRFFSKVEVCWHFVPPVPSATGVIHDRNGWDTLWYWRSQPAVSSIAHSYEHGPKEPPHNVTTVLRYWVVDDPVVRNKLGLVPGVDYVDHEFTLQSRPDGIVFLRDSATANKDIQVTMTKQGDVTPDGRLQAQITVRRVGEVDPSSEATLAVVIVAKNGAGPWAGSHARFAIAPQRFRIADLNKSPITKDVVLDLPAAIGHPESPSDRWPTELEAIVVALPFDWGPSQIRSADLDLSSPAVKNSVFASADFRWDHATQSN